MFGIGWGLVGLCPGPALVNLATFSPQVIVFVAAMAAGMVLHDSWSARRAAAATIAAGGRLRRQPRSVTICPPSTTIVVPAM